MVSTTKDLDIVHSFYKNSKLREDSVFCLYGKKIIKSYFGTNIYSTRVIKIERSVKWV